MSGQELQRTDNLVDEVATMLDGIGFNKRYQTEEETIVEAPGRYGEEVKVKPTGIRRVCVVYELPTYVNNFNILEDIWKMEDGLPTEIDLGASIHTDEEKTVCSVSTEEPEHLDTLVEELEKIIQRYNPLAPSCDDVIVVSTTYNDSVFGLDDEPSLDFLENRVGAHYT